MVIRLSGVLFGLWSYEWLENRTTTKQESVCLSRNSPVWLGKIIVATVIIINSSFGGSSWFWLQSVLTLVMVYLPAADMSLANSKSPTLATKLASTKIFLAAKSWWTNCERRQCIIFLLRHARWLSGLCKCAKDPQCVLKLIYKLGLHAFFRYFAWQRLTSDWVAYTKMQKISSSQPRTARVIFSASRDHKLFIISWEQSSLMEGWQIYLYIYFYILSADLTFLSSKCCIPVVIWNAIVTSCR